jgi:hypothetical protein
MKRRAQGEALEPDGWYENYARQYRLHCEGPRIENWDPEGTPVPENLSEEAFYRRLKQANRTGEFCPDPKNLTDLDEFIDHLLN